MLAPLKAGMAACMLSWRGWGSPTPSRLKSRANAISIAESVLLDEEKMVPPLDSTAVDASRPSTIAADALDQGAHLGAFRLQWKLANLLLAGSKRAKMQGWLGAMVPQEVPFPPSIIFTSPVQDFALIKRSVQPVFRSTPGSHEATLVKTHIGNCKVVLIVPKTTGMTIVPRRSCANAPNSCVSKHKVLPLRLFPL